MVSIIVNNCRADASYLFVLRSVRRVLKREMRLGREHRHARRCLWSQAIRLHAARRAP